MKYQNALALLVLCGCTASHAIPVATPQFAFPATNAHAVRWFAVKGGKGLAGIASGPDGALWFTERLSSRIGRITTSGKQTSYPTATANASPLAIAAGPDKALWFTEFAASRVGRITTAGRVTEFKVSHTPTGAIAAGPDGAIWFTELESTTNYIARLTTTGSLREYRLRGTKNGAVTAGIATGPDKALWFTLQQSNAVGRITTLGRAKLYPNGDGDAEPSAIANVSGQIWVGESSGVARVGTSGTFTEYAVPYGGGILSITTGPQNNVWFGASQGNYVGTVSGGKVVPYSLGGKQSSIVGITYGRDRALWVLDALGDRVGRFTP